MFYHYLKWATITIFIKRNVKNLSFILAGILLHLLSGIIYQDFMSYFEASKDHTSPKYLLTAKMISLVISIFLIYKGVKGFIGGKKDKNFQEDNKKILPNKKKEDQIPLKELEKIENRLKKFEIKDELSSLADQIIKKKSSKRS